MDIMEWEENIMEVEEEWDSLTIINKVITTTTTTIIIIIIITNRINRTNLNRPFNSSMLTTLEVGA